MSDLTELGFAEVRHRFRDRSLSPVELARAYLDRIERLNPTLNAYLTVAADLALIAAQDSEHRLIAGAEMRPLEGIPVALKDNIAVAGLPMAAGSPFLTGNMPNEDATVTRRLIAAGAVILGKLNMHEWALGATGVNPHVGSARNPWDTGRMTGGSSSGAGAALGADLTVLALGSDTGGSGRIPAALCGVSGLRPTTGRISNRGVVPLAWSFDVVSPMARRAADVAHLLGVLAGYDPADPTSANVPVPDNLPPQPSVIGLRIALLSGFFQHDLEPGIGAATRAAAGVLEGLGADIEETEIPGIKDTLSALTTMLQAEAAAFHADRLASAPELFGPSVAERLHAAGRRTAPEYGAARQTARVWQRKLSDLMGRFDLLLCPTCAVTAPPIGDAHDVPVTRALTRLTYPWSISALPAISLPAGFSRGLPVGVQLVGAPWREDTVLRAADALQAATSWHLRRPEDLVHPGAPV